MTMSVMFSSMLFQPFAGAQIENCGGEEDDGCDSKNGVVHISKIRRACLGSGQRAIRILLAGRNGEVAK